MRFQTGWDAADYIPLAQGIEHGCGFARYVDGHCGSPDISRPPGYPYFVAAMPGLRSVLVVQAILGALLCLWIGWFVSGRWGIGAGVLTASLLALDIPSIVYGGMIMSEATFQFLLTGAILLQLSAIMADEWNWQAIGLGIAAAIMLGAAAMIRPTGIFLPLFAPLPFLILFSRRDWLPALAFAVVAFAITLTPMMAWTARNKRVTGVNVPSSDSAVTLYYVGAAGVLAYSTHQPFDEVYAELRREIRASGNSGLTDDQLASEMIRKSVEIYAAHPIAAIIETVRGMILVATVPDRNSLNTLIGTNGGGPLGLPPSYNIVTRIRRTMRSPVLSALATFQFIVMVFVWVGIVRGLIGTNWKSKVERACVLVPLAAAFAMLACAASPEAHARFRVPAIPFLALLAGIGWLGSRSTVPSRCEYIVDDDAMDVPAMASRAQG